MFCYREKSLGRTSGHCFPVIQYLIKSDTRVIPICQTGKKPVPLYLTKRLLIMSPRRAQQPEKTGTTPRLKAGPSKNRERHLEDARHHPSDHPLPHPPHKSIKKPVLPPKHTPHSHPHGDELPPHTNPPGPIKPSKKMTKTGSRP
jgi:hypothetical protein